MLLLFIASILCYGCAPHAADCFSNSAPAVVALSVVNHGRHAGLIIPGSETLFMKVPELNRFPKSSFYEFGWGDEYYYPASDPGISAGFRALFYSSGSVLHVSAFDEEPEKFFRGAEIIKIEATGPATAEIENFISQSFKRGHGGIASPTAPGLYGEALFFPSTRSFSISYTCNTWVSEALAPVCCKEREERPIFVSSLFDKLERCRANR